MKFYTWLEANHGRTHRKNIEESREPLKLSSFIMLSLLIDWTNQDQRKFGNVERKLPPPTRPLELAGIGKPDWKLWTSPIRFSLHKHRFEKPRAHTNSPQLDEAIGTGFVRRRGRNRKNLSELPCLLSSISLSSWVYWVIQDHRCAHRVEANHMGPVWRREMAGRRSWVWRVHDREERRWWGSGEISLIYYIYKTHRLKTNGLD